MKNLDPKCHSLPVWIFSEFLFYAYVNPAGLTSLTRPLVCPLGVYKHTYILSDSPTSGISQTFDILGNRRHQQVISEALGLLCSFISHLLHNYYDK